MRKKILLIFIFLLLFLFFTKKALAQDFTVTCQAGNCDVVPAGPIFNETNIYPGWSLTKIVKGVNDYGQDTTFAVEVINLTSLGGLSDVLTLNIRESGAVTNIYEDNLTNFENYGYLTLSDVASGGSQDYDFTVTMQESADNDYQGLTSTFDLTLGFELIPVPSPSPTASPTPSPSPCTAPSAPTGLTATTVSSSVLSLSWTAPPEGVTHYAISYGLSSGNYIYGASNVGNVTSYVVSGLSSGTTYYFVVYSVNDCDSSGASNEASATTAGVLGAYITPGPAPGFEVLGEATPSEEEIPFYPGVAGEEMRCFWWQYLWWLPLLVQVILSGLYGYWLRKKKQQGKELGWYYYLLPVLLAVLSQTIHWFLGCECVVSSWCPWYWLFNLIILSSSLILIRRVNKQFVTFF